MLYGHMDPNQPVRPGIPGLCDDIIPNVESWNGLFNETVPLPYAWNKPRRTVGGGSLTGGVSGGVTTHGFRVEEERRVRVKVPSSEMPWVDQYKKRGSQLVVRAQRQIEQGMYTSVL